ncbi:MAG: hypothetical protein AAF483_30895, partial [Planctomycetota bacterium]
KLASVSKNWALRSRPYRSDFYQDQCEIREGVNVSDGAASRVTHSPERSCQLSGFVELRVSRNWCLGGIRHVAGLVDFTHHSCASIVDKTTS